ncbi:MAG: phosphodiesterase YaeI [Bryobacterales bacterium]|nr:phosphodiesterase YaeI [Bryobacterales bacterium]
MQRRKLLAMAAPAIVVPAWFRFGEPHWFELTRRRVKLGVRRRLVLHVSDLHTSDGLTAEDLEAGLEMGLRQRPDLICFTGDFVTTTRGYDRVGLERLLRRAADTAATYAVLGNHDGGAWLGRRGGSASPREIADLVEGAGIRLLRNEWVVDGDLTLVGVEDYWSGELDGERAFGGAPEGVARVLLSHNPDAKGELVEQGWDLMLSGHTHGGQARLPGWTPPWAPVADKRYVEGLHEWGGRQLFVTRGMGSPKHVRAFCRPEVSILEFGA